MFEAMMYRSGSHFSQFGCFLNRDRRVGEVSMAMVSSAAVIVEEIESDSYTCSTNNAAKRLLLDNNGILFICCPGKNPVPPL